LEAKKQIIQNKTFKQETSIETFPLTLSPSPSSISQDCYQSIQTFDCPSWFTIGQLIAHIVNNGAYGLSEEFKNIRSQPIISSYDSFKQIENSYKNRYRDVICLDESRVKLQVDSNKTNYIHANFVDGYKQRNAFINAQGPLDETVEEFWLMIWQQLTLVIAMTTKVLEQRKLKCSQYWPLEIGQSLKIENLFEILNTQVQDLGDYRVTNLTIKHLPTGENRHIAHCQFLSWPDHGVPRTASQILEFIEIVRQNQINCLNQLNESRQIWTGHPLGPPICVHCSAGIGRTGTFCAIDISINRLNDCKKIHIEETINKIRMQRAQSVQTRDQYVFCYMALLEYAQRKNILNDSIVDLEKFFDNLY